MNQTAKVVLKRKAEDQLSEFFLPDFCRPQSILMVILIAELLAVVFTLLTIQTKSNYWQVLGLYSISLQWINLSSVLILCQLRPYISRLNDLSAGLISLSVILLATFIYTFIAIAYFYGLNFDLTQAIQLQLIIKNLIIAGLMGSVLLRYFYLHQQYRKQVTLESSARLDALQARIRPHFLFNSMNVIASLTRIDPKKAESAIEDLSDLIRATLNNKDELIPLNIELENGKRYLSLEQLRLGDRLSIKWKIDAACLKILVPPLSVQPLLENAVYHGIQMLPDGGEVSINIFQQNNLLHITVSNPKLEKSEYKGNGIALDNISQRLDVIFGHSAKLIRENKPAYYKATIILPTKPPIH